MARSPELKSDASARLVSLDAYRGFVMICLAANGFGIAATAKNFPNNATWQALRYQFDHVPWTGCGFWDLIQPSFMFMVGVSLPYSYAKRQAAGESYWRLMLHAIVRSIVLILLGIFLSSGGKPITNYTFMNVLTQIGLGYTFLFLLWNRSRIIQLNVASLILVGYWAWFALTPVVACDATRLDYPILTGFAAHWQKFVNPAATFDLWFLNLFPRTETYVQNDGGYQTLNFVPSLATMIGGLITGESIRSGGNRFKTLATMAGSGAVLVALGWSLDHFGVCPSIKRIWTPSWALFSTGLTLLMLSGFYCVIDVIGIRFWAFPLTVAGMNSIALYVMAQLLKNWTAENLQRHFGQNLFDSFGTQYAPIVKANLVLLMFWLFVWWLYRQKIFFRI